MLVASCHRRVVSGAWVAVILVLIIVSMLAGPTRSWTNGKLSPGVAQTEKRMQTRSTTSGSFDRTIATQKRLNRYFHADVVPKLGTCWNRVQGRGEIAFDFSYMRDARDQWAFQKLGVGRSTLPKGQDAVALACMRDSVRATSFPPAEFDSGKKEFVVHWSWPVPFPTDASD